MITRPTVFVLGAGASYGFNYPLGKNLKDIIIKNFDAGDDHPHPAAGTLGEIGGLALETAGNILEPSARDLVCFASGFTDARHFELRHSKPLFSDLIVCKPSKLNFETPANYTAFISSYRSVLD